MNLTHQASNAARTQVMLNSVKKGVFAMLDQGVVSGLSFVTSIIVGRVAGKSELGFYAFGMSIVLFCISLQQSLVSAPHTIFVIRLKDDESRTYNGSMLAFALCIMGTVAALLSFAAVVVSLDPARKELWSILAVVAIVGPAVLCREFSRKFLFAFKAVTSALILDSVIAFLQIALLLLLVWTNQLSGLHSLLVVAASCLVICGYWYYKNLKQFVFSWPSFLRDMKHSWSFGRWVFAGQVSMALIGVVLNWLLLSFGGSEANGAFGACMMLILLANPFILGMQNLLSPNMAAAMNDQGCAEVKRLVVQSTIKLGAVMAVFAVVISLFGNLIVTFVYGPGYSGQQFAILFLALGSFLLAVGVSSNHGLRAIERPELNFLAAGLGLVSASIVAFMLIEEYGVLGAAVGYFAGNLMVAVVRFVSFMLVWNSNLIGAEN